MGALSHIRICDFTGQLAGAGATRTLGAFGAQIIKIEDPVTEGRWDILRGMEPFVDERRGGEFGGGFQNHNVEKLGITLNLRTERGRELLTEIVRISDVVAENFAGGVLAKLGFPYETLRDIREDVIYVSNCGFGHRGPYSSFKTWGPIVQSSCGLTFTSGLPDMPPAGWGYSYMDHHGANFMCFAILAALVHRNRTGQGQWVDMSCTDAGASMLGPVVLDYTVNGRPTRRPGFPYSSRSDSPRMAPHNVYPALGDDQWCAIACRDDDDWTRIVAVVGATGDGGWVSDPRFATLAGRLEHQDELDDRFRVWCDARDKFAVQELMIGAGVPGVAVQLPEERIEHDPGTTEQGLWPWVEHPLMGAVRVDGLPYHLSETDWHISEAAPLLGEDNDVVFGEILGLSEAEIADLRTEGVI